MASAERARFNPLSSRERSCIFNLLFVRYFPVCVEKGLGCKKFVIMEKKFLRTEQLDQNSAVANYFLFFFSLKTA